MAFLWFLSEHRTPVLDNIMSPISGRKSLSSRLSVHSTGARTSALLIF